ncbi:MAG: hypothetical protein WKF73_11800 [Nocardioidaceae bacterium]
MSRTSLVIGTIECGRAILHLDGADTRWRGGPNLAGEAPRLALTGETES